MEHSPSQKLIVVQLVKKFSSLYISQTFSTMFTRTTTVKPDNQVLRLPIRFLKIDINIILPFMLRSSNQLLFSNVVNSYFVGM
jgi:hypothetical protein